jgi:hypothetical protein
LEDGIDVDGLGDAERRPEMARSQVARKPKTTLVVALTSFVAEDAEREEYLVRQGEKLASDHPIVKGREHLFGPESEAESCRPGSA